MEILRATGLLLIAVLTAAACHSKPVIVPAISCADSCCAGDPLEVDCAENPNLQCSQPPDETCSSARNFGCADGSFVAPSPCETPDAGDEGDDEAEAAAEDVDLLVFPDASAAPADAATEAADSAAADAAVPEGGAND